MFQDDNKSQSSNNASEDTSDEEEVMIKQESNYEGQGDHDAIKEDNDQILNHDQDVSNIQKLFTGVKGKALLPLKDIAEIIERNYKSGISEKQ